MATELQEEGGIEGVSFLDGLISQETRRRTREQTQPLIDACCSPGCIRSTVLTVGVALLLLTTLLVAIYLSHSETSNAPILNTKDPPYWMLNQVTSNQLLEHMKFLSDDLLEGRAPGTRGEGLAASYIASHFRTAGLEPLPRNTSADADEFIHTVPMRGLTALPGGYLRFGNSTHEMVFNQAIDFSSDSDLDTNNVTISVQVVFAGYCMLNKFRNDFLGINATYMSDKIVICLMGNPPLAPYYSKPSVVTDYLNNAATKLEYVRNLNALGVLMVHDEVTSGYSWEVFQHRFGTGEQVSTLNPYGLLFKGWITRQMADTMAMMGGSSLSQWEARISYNMWQQSPLELSHSLLVDVKFRVREFETKFVAGYLGPAPLPFDYRYAYYGNAYLSAPSSIILTAHHDHLGVRPFFNSTFPSFNPYYKYNYTSPNNTSTDGKSDEIYNGAVDNASGLAALLSSAYAISALYKEPFIVNPNYEPIPLEKTIIFLTTTAHEYNLGNSYFASNHFCTLRLCNAKAVFNFDVMNVWGHTVQAVILGKEMSSMVSSAADSAIKAEGMYHDPPANRTHGRTLNNTQQGVYPFIINGVPSITFATGSDQNPAPVLNYMATKQYRANDEFQPNMDMSGVLQQVRIALRMAYTIAIDQKDPQIDGLDYVNGLW